jgi:hypothetical protein
MNQILKLRKLVLNVLHRVMMNRMFMTRKYQQQIRHHQQLHQIMIHILQILIDQYLMMLIMVIIKKFDRFEKKNNFRFFLCSSRTKT